MDKLLELGTHLAYLLRIDKSLWSILRKYQEYLFDLGLNCLAGNITNEHAEIFLNMLGKLMTSQQCCDLMSKNMMGGDRIFQTLKINLCLLTQKMEW